MKKYAPWILVILSSVFAGFLAGLLAGRSISSDQVEIAPMLQESTAATIQETTPSETAEDAQQAAPQQKDQYQHRIPG